MNLLELFPPVRTFIFEADHVLTDGYIGLGAEHAATIRRFFARDLYAIHKAIQKGYQISVVRIPELPMLPAGITESGIKVIDGRDRIPVVTEATTTLYMNSIYPAAHAARQDVLYCCPADAIPEVKALAAYISPYNGGAGCVYDVI